MINEPVKRMQVLTKFYMRPPHTNVNLSLPQHKL